MGEKDGFYEQYIYAIALYLLLTLDYAYNTIIESTIVGLCHMKYDLDDLNSTAKKYLSMLMTKAQLPISRGYDNHT